MVRVENGAEAMIDVSMLNRNQKDAVLSDDKYLRIIAGAGSGKTRVLTMRIAHLIEDEDVRPYKILAITFTNKAANEMKERIRRMLEDEGSQAWISTIHSLCVRILREDIPCMGYPKNFTIMDADDQKSVVREAVKQLELADTGLTPNQLIDYISNNKAADLSAEQAKKLAGDIREEKAKASVYEYYLNRQRQLFALDFDDLILWTVRMFSKFPDVLAKWQRRFEYILVDEFQDIDNMQYKLIRQLAGTDASIYVVGDPDQTIYTWRGADVNIIMNFEKDYKPCKTIILNENYRSTSSILNAANSVIANNKNRMKKELFTSRSSDTKVTHYAAMNDEYEAAWIAGKIAELHQKGKKYSDMAVLYRSNYLSRSLEKGMMDQRIPYVIYGGIRFYERQEVKDALCYLRMCTTGDDLALQRVLNRPKRGIGAKTLDRIADTAREQETSMYEALKQHPEIFTGKAKKTLASFVTMVEKWRGDLSAGLSVSDLFDEILEDSGYLNMLKEDKEKGEERQENLKALMDDIRTYTENNPDTTLDDYLQQVALYTDRDSGEVSDCVQMMTVHAAKGLEFDTVFVSDMNEGIFPNERAMSEGNRGVEEERRLAYVAFTRARNKLYLTEAGGYSYVLQRMRTTSRFINEIDDRYIEHTGSQERRRSVEVSSGMFERHGQRNRNVQLSSAVFEDHGHNMEERKSSGRMVKKGDHVIHTKFGEGVVINVNNGIAQIAFAYPYGIKKIAAGHPSLKKKK